MEIHQNINIGNEELDWKSGKVITQRNEDQYPGRDNTHHFIEERKPS